MRKASACDYLLMRVCFVRLLLLVPGCLRSLAGARGTLAYLAFFAGSARLFAGFSDVSSTTGINYLHAAPGAPQSAVFSAPAAAVDVDGDGWTDLVAGRADGPCVLYINQRDGTFREEAVVRGLGGAVGIGAIVAADFTNTGRRDLFMVPLEGYRCFLYVNDGTGHFSEQAAARGADLATTQQPHGGFSASLVDFDRDGYLDVYFTEWGTPKSTEDALHSALLRNRGAAAPGHFENVTLAAGLKQPRTGDAHYGYSAAWADFDADGWPDLALVADFTTSQLFWNNGNGVFIEQGKASGVALDENGMGLAVADIDGDGRLDFFVTSIFDRVSYEAVGLKAGNKLYRNLGGRRFAETAAAAGVDRTGWGWGAAFLDYDHNGSPDLIVTNGMTADYVPDPNLPHSSDPLTDPTTLFANDGSGKFTPVTEAAGLHDTGQGRAVVVFDLDNDGDQDVVITQAYGRPVVYRSDASTNGRRWLRLRLQGTLSNRDGIGAVVTVTQAGRTQTQLLNPTAAFLAQHESILHFGLGVSSASVDSVTVRWPSGVVQTVIGLSADQTLTLIEPSAQQIAPSFTQTPADVTLLKDQPLVLTAAATGDPAPVYVWRKDGVVLAGVSGPTLQLAHVHPADAGAYTVQALNPKGAVTSAPAVVTVVANLAAHSIARWWDEALLDAIRKDLPAPTVHARNLWHLSAAMWDAFWAYQPEGWTQAEPLYVREVVASTDWTGGRELAQRQAISYAAFRVLTERYKSSPGRDRSFAGFRWLMLQQGFDPDFTGTTGSSPAAVGNRIGYGVLAATLNDGANEAGGYADTSGYVASNPPLAADLPGITLLDPNRWQPLSFNNAVTQNGIPLGAIVQTFVGANWRWVQGFALARPSPGNLVIDPGPPPLFGTATEAEYQAAAVELVRRSSLLDPADGVLVDISPSAQFNHPLGTNAGTGHARNPSTGKPYAPNVVLRADYGRVLAEFWADGPQSETPPGHWNVLFNQVTDDPRCVRRIGGLGPELSILEWDVRGYLTLNGAVHDAAVAAWTVKRQYDSARPISMVRYLASLGQSSDPGGLGYHPHGIPLVPGMIEVVTPASSAPGQRHENLANQVGKVALRVWRGGPTDPTTQVGGVGWISAGRWVPYQRSTFVTPAFAGYVSGHSTFSRAAAEVMTLFTGTSYFPGGLMENRFAAGKFLAFEKGPSTDVTLQWATYYDAADEAGLSRLWGGIHIPADDFSGRRMGSQIGLDAFLRAQRLRSGAAPSSAGLINLSARGQMGAGGEAMITGFVLDGGLTESTLVRTVGTGLSRYGVSDPARDPRLELRRAGADAIISANDDWDVGPGAPALAAQIQRAGAFPLMPGEGDAAAAVSLPAGGYTVVSRMSSPATSGVLLSEVYSSNLVNLSARMRTGGTRGPLIAGFVVGGTESVLILVRAVGPGLTQFGVNEVLANPKLEIFRHQADGTAVSVAVNDDWLGDERASLSVGAATRTGAFALAPGSQDAALVLQLEPGAYSAVVTASGGGAAEGEALVEVYWVR